MTYAEKLKDPRWQKKRLEILSEANFTCQWCNDSKSTLHVHHFYYARGKNPWEYESWDLCCVCESCHKVAHLKNIPEAIKDALCTLQVNPVQNGSDIQILNHYLIKYYGE